MDIIVNPVATDGLDFQDAGMSGVYRVSNGLSRWTYRLGSNGVIQVWSRDAGWLYVATWTETGVIDSGTGPDIIRAAHEMLGSAA